MRNTFNSLLYAFSIAPPTGLGGQRPCCLGTVDISKRCNVSSLVWSPLSSIARDWDYDYAELMV